MRERKPLNVADIRHPENFFVFHKEERKTLQQDEGGYYVADPDAPDNKCYLRVTEDGVIEGVTV